MIEDKELLIMSDGLNPVLEELPVRRPQQMDIEKPAQESNKNICVEFVQLGVDKPKNIKLHCKLESYTCDFSNKMYSYNVSVLSKHSMEDFLFIDDTYRAKVSNRITIIVQIGFSYSYDGSLFLNFTTKD